MPTLIYTIARTAFLESVRQPVYFILILIAGLMQIFNTAATGYSLGYTESGEVSGDNKLLLDLALASIFLCGTLLAGFIATATISREIENKTVLTVVSKPVPRPAVILGKFLGTSGALVIATLIMIVFLLMGIRHGVMSTARDEVDTVVTTLAFASVLLAVSVAVWGNFFYGWHFAQTASLLLCPILLVATILMYSFGKGWRLQPLFTDIKPQILLAAFSLVLGMLVLSAIATAASTRLGQVMTIVVCFGAFVLGLLSNWFIGRHVYHTTIVGQIQAARPERDAHQSFAGMGDIYFVTLKSVANRAVKPGDAFYYSGSPDGAAMPVPRFAPFVGGASDDSKFFSPGAPAALIVTEARARELVVRNVGNPPVAVERPPRENDYIFAEPVRTSILPLVAWGIAPNMQFFWLSDAVTQNRPVPLNHISRIAAYAGVQVLGFLSLAVILFQRREVG
jgi:ABC-type transport system involved in multi-copper enzyme maturation permease subunit